MNLILRRQIEMRPSETILGAKKEFFILYCQVDLTSHERELLLKYNIGDLLLLEENIRESELINIKISKITEGIKLEYSNLLSMLVGEEIIKKASIKLKRIMESLGKVGVEELIDVL